MKKMLMLITSVVAVIGLSGCGGGGDYYDDAPRVTYYLQTYDDVSQDYVGVSDVYYECGPDIVNYTDRNGAFTMIEGDTCTFYDLDDSLSFEYGTLYISPDVGGIYGLGDINYYCDSGISDITDPDGMFIFDPTYISRASDGDVCEFNF